MKNFTVFKKEFENIKKDSEVEISFKDEEKYLLRFLINLMNIVKQ